MVDASQVPHVRYNLNEAWEFDIAAAAAQWNGIESPLFYYYPSFEQTEFGYLTLKKYDFSNAGWQDAPGVTFNNSYSQPHTTSDVYLNTDFNWNINGNMNQSLRKVDVRTIVVHEFGHSSGLTQDLAPASLSAPGNRVLLFLGEQRDVGDGLQAATPNMVYVVDTSGRAVSTDGGHIITLDAFRVLIQS
jgi:hypothetical protein